MSLVASPPPKLIWHATPMRILERAENAVLWRPRCTPLPTAAHSVSAAADHITSGSGALESPTIALDSCTAATASVGTLTNAIDELHLSASFPSSKVVAVSHASPSDAASRPRPDRSPPPSRSTSAAAAPTNSHTPSRSPSRCSAILSPPATDAHTPSRSPPRCASSSSPAARSAPPPTVPVDEIVRFLDQLNLGSERVFEIEFVSGVDRKDVHAACERLNSSVDAARDARYVSQSHGFGRDRRAFVTRHAAADVRGERAIARSGRYAALHGAAIERAAADFFASPEAAVALPPAYRARRELRDGPEHHLTILNASEMRDLQVAAGNGDSDAIESDASRIAFAESVLDRLAADVVDDWCALGVGRATQPGGNEAIFIVVDWPSLNAWRTSALGLVARDLHITLGYRDADVHDVCKNERSLFWVPPPPSKVC